MKTLVILAHPNLAQSTVNRAWANALAQQPERYTVHDLYRRYPGGRIDIDTEQALVDTHAAFVLQFPVYWFNCPPLLKQWLDGVLTHGWAYGSRATALAGKKAGIAVSLGAPTADYTADGAIGCTVAEVLRPFELTLRYCRAAWQPLFHWHGIDSNAVYDDTARAAVAQSAQDYLAHLVHYYP